MRVLIAVAASLVLILLIVVFSDYGCILQLVGLSPKDEGMSINVCIASLFGLVGHNSKNEVLKFLGIGIAGLLLMLQALIANRRAKAMQRAAEAQGDAANAQGDFANQQVIANKHTEDGQRQERLKNAIEHLGHRSGSVRMGGAYELFHLAQDNPELGQTILDILCAHIRTRTGEKKYRDDNQSSPSVEVQSLLNLLFRQNHEVFDGFVVDLKGSWLNGAELHEAHLSEAILSAVHLREALLWEAHLQGADLWEAHLQGANLQGAHLQGSELRGAWLQDVDLQDAQLQGANLQQSQLQCANLRDAQLQGADLQEAQLQSADLEQTKLQGVRLPVEGSPGEGSQRDLFVERMTSGVGIETNLEGVTFEGGLNEESLEELLAELPPERAEVLEDNLRRHVDRPPSYQLPTECGAVTGAYTTKQVLKWIADYPERSNRNRASGLG